MATKAQVAARTGMFKDLTEMQKIISEMWAANSLPPGWDFMEEKFPCTPKKRKVSLYVDEDVLGWYQKLGRGYQGRINAVLRIYRNGVMSGDVKGFDTEYAQGPEQVYYLREAEAQFERTLQEMARDGRLSKEGIAAMGAEQSQVLDTGAAREEIMRRLAAIQRAAAEDE
jgi:uncharacterized protein (DUF4415 family)